MKSKFTCGEMAKVFAQVDKVESAVKVFVEITDRYNKIDAAFDDEFSKYGYTFFNAPEELHTMFDEKCAAMDERDKAERRAYKTIKDFGMLIGIGENYVDIVEERVKRFIDMKYYWQAGEMIERVKCIALEAARKVKVYA